MSDHVAVRLWLGWRTTQSQSDSDWGAFKKSLAETFIPATWEIMGNFKLKAYVPSIFRPSGTSGLPEEIALLCYETKRDYEESKNTILGRSYRTMHQAIFEFKHAGRASKANWCGTSENDMPYIAAAKSTGKQFDDPGALIHVLLLSTPAQTASLSIIMDIFSEQRGDIAVWIQKEFTALWVVSSTALDKNQISAELSKKISGVQLVVFHCAAPAPPIDQQRGLPVVEDQSWHFHS